MKTKTELHTHLIGMLSEDEFLKLISVFTDTVYWPLDHPYDDSSTMISIAELINSKLYKNLLKIEHGSSVNYDDLDNYYNSRSELLKYVINICDKKFNNKIKAETLVFSMYINSCLRELINQGVEYVEISYSNSRIIKNIIIDENISNKIRCKFLLSTDRTRTLDNFKSSSKNLKKILQIGLSCGFDIMGRELAITDVEKDSTDKSKSSQSFKNKLEVIIDSMNGFNNSTIRIHSGETAVSYDNTLLTLEYLKELKEEKGITIPPPEIRIGHGIYFKDNETYLSLLREFNVIIEINASSNIALSNIEAYNILPYDYYLENGIRVVLSTDGHGLYDTTIPLENEIASHVSKHNDHLEMIDEELMSQKL